MTDVPHGSVRSDGRPVLVPRPLGSAYRLGASVRLDHPPSGTADCAALVLFETDASARTGYAVRLRELTGVPYVGLLRREGGEETVVAETLHGLNLGADHRLEVRVDGPRLAVSLDGQQVLTALDPGRLHGDHVGLAAVATTAALRDLRVEQTEASPTLTPPRVSDSRPPANAYRGEPTTVESTWHRARVVPLSWPGGGEARLELSVRRGEGGWSPPVALGDCCLVSGSVQARDVWATADLSRVIVERVRAADETTLRLTARADGFDDVELSLDIGRHDPVLQVTAIPRTDARVSLLLNGFEGRPLDQVTEVVCGPLQHARMVRDRALLPASEMTTPFALVETTGEQRVTWGVGVPAVDLRFEDEQNRDADDQPFALCLRDRDGDVRPTVCVPAPGRRADRAARQRFSERVLIVLDETGIDETFEGLLRREYAYRAYREPLFGQSLTDTVMNLVDLVGMDPTGDDVEYAASPSGWWSRAKNFIDIENLETVRSTTAGVLLSAAYLTDDPDLYDRRARPVLEFHLSRNGYGWTPIPGRRVYGDESRNQLCSTPVGISALGPLHDMTRRRNPGIAALAGEPPGVTTDYWRQRAPFLDSLHTFRLTGDPVHLAAARRQADDYIATDVDGLRTEPVDPHDFAVFYVADWVGLLELHLETSEPAYLDAAHREARRFATQVFVRPVTDRQVTLPSTPTIHDRQIELGRWWGPARLYRYPRTELPVEPAPGWAASICGMGFEAVQTLRHSGPTMNPGWAAAMLRLAFLKADDLLADVAHNSIAGRFSSYPGYYYRQQNVTMMQPDFPLLGPFDASTLYYHHAPGQLGLVMDYLITEHEVRSGGRVAFPAVFEENFVWFRYRTYGHRPGRFHNIDDVWLWMPKGIVSVDNARVSWLTGERDRTTFVVSLTNSTSTAQCTRVRFDSQLSLPHRCLATRYDNQATAELTVEDGVVDVEVPAWGHVGLAFHNIGPVNVRLREDQQTTAAGSRSYSFDDQTALGPVRGILLARPDGTGHDAYVQSTCRTPATLDYSLDDGNTWTANTKTAHPAEWTVFVPAGRTIRYRLSDMAVSTDDMVLEA
jgi:hypothetical protein